MTDDEKKKYKQILNQACKNTRYLYEFYVDNAIASLEHRACYTRYYRCYSTFPQNNKSVYLNKCDKSFKICIHDGTWSGIRTFKLIGKYK